MFRGLAVRFQGNIGNLTANEQGTTPIKTIITA
jgi:hypothetical protein